MLRFSPRTRLRRRPVGLVLVIAALPLATACSAFSDDPGEPKQVAAAFYPLAWVSEQIAGDHLDVVSVTKPGGEPHDLELTPRETALIADSGVVIYEADFQPAVDAAIEANATGTVLDVTDAVNLIPFDAEDHSDHSGEGHSGEGSEEEHSTDDGHDHGENDPHFWQDPARMAELGDAVADTFAEVDPDHADDYRDAAAALRTRLEKLDRDYADGLADCQRDVLVVNHDAFGYLTKYGVHVEPIVGITPDAAPTAADQEKLRDLIRTEKITTVFAETLGSSKKAAETLSDDLGLTLDVLDPIEGPASSDAEDDYVALMRANLTKIEKANGC